MGEGRASRGDCSWALSPNKSPLASDFSQAGQQGNLVNCLLQIKDRVMILWIQGRNPHNEGVDALAAREAIDRAVVAAVEIVVAVLAKQVVQTSLAVEVVIAAAAVERVTAPAAFEDVVAIGRRREEDPDPEGRLQIEGDVAAAVEEIIAAA